MNNSLNTAINEITDKIYERGIKQNPFDKIRSWPHLCSRKTEITVFAVKKLSGFSIEEQHWALDVLASLNIGNTRSDL